MRVLLPAPAEVGGPENLESVYAVVGDHLRVNFVSSLDGAIEIDGLSGPLGGPADRQVFRAVRAVADVVLVAAGTVRAENYGPAALEEAVVARRKRRGQKPELPIAVVTGRGDLDPSMRIFSSGSRPLVMTTGAVSGSRPDLAAVAELVDCGEERVDLVRVVADLRGRGYRRILCEGGPSLVGSLLSAGLVDELCLTISPVLAASRHRHLVEEGSLGGPTRFALGGLVESDGLLFCRYHPVGGA